MTTIPADHAPSREDVRASYDRVAEEYARRIAGELAHKPLDRTLLDAFAGRVRGAGPVVDAGCGPGHVTRYLADRGVEASGLDLSPGMVDQARALHPDVPFRVGDVTALDAEKGAWAGAVAYYSLIHLPRPVVVRALRELARVLRPGAPLFIGFHAGSETRHMDEWWGQPVRLDFVFFSVGEMTGYLRQAGFTVEQVTERSAYPDVEAPTRRAYILATNAPATAPSAAADPAERPTPAGAG
ncbi:class I SAM-dependent methyltransferase [Longimicrobium terrae]|uniref:SAM-dependent methyltransferase n=1 Tax=Longimicrobium terrae TaxID=1639882 RepID=A0A841GUQ4_9BACT|nr:class I SAM-dependent methyltransferase [Longimicrobium terrae]MBB4634226.1 SAM-dependent methyltransferase [Longimicrobium terrae]MBB6068884.1 SAM-dependent methyltransferase [Longimicrobium terrae]NNC28064.1 class I SAM-dependent methyltransferase [Longimicrobium terrae]